MTAPNGYGRAGFYAQILGVIFVLIGAIFWVGSIANQVSANSTGMVALGVRIAALETDLRRNDLETSSIERDLREVETQFCSTDIVRNLMHATDLRTTSLLWQKVFSTPYPTDNAFYPQICNRPIAGQ